MAFGSAKGLHRANAGSHAKTARGFAQKARAAAKRGECRTALHLFGASAFTAGLAAGERTHAGRKGHRGGSRMGSRVHALQSTIFKLCRIG